LGDDLQTGLFKFTERKSSGLTVQEENPAILWWWQKTKGKATTAAAVKGRKRMDEY
jgi:hypothetical protein